MMTNEKTKDCESHPGIEALAYVCYYLDKIPRESVSVPSDITVENQFDYYAELTSIHPIVLACSKNMRRSVGKLDADFADDLFPGETWKEMRRVVSTTPRLAMAVRAALGEDWDEEVGA